jgi:hypothetical protein
MKTALYAPIIFTAGLIVVPEFLFAPQSHAARLGDTLRTRVEQDVLRKLKPYFPKAKTNLDQKGTLIILTCARNLGPMMLRNIQPEIESQFYSAGLLAEIGLTLTRTKRVGAGFEREILIFNLNSRQDTWIDGAQISGYVEAYPTICN